MRGTRWRRKWVLFQHGHQVNRVSKVIGVIGSRSRDGLADIAKTERAFRSIYQEGDTIVSGGCSRGGDRFAEIIAAQLNVPIKIHPAMWKEFGRRAGFARNQFIADDADVLIAVVARDRTGGTEDTIKKFGNKGALILVI